MEHPKNRVSALGCHDNILAIGTDNGYVFSYEIKKISDEEYKYEAFNQQTQGKKRGNSKIEQIKILPFNFHIVLLVGNALSLVKFDSLETYQDIKKKVSSFCINNSIYENFQ